MKLINRATNTRSTKAMMVLAFFIFSLITRDIAQAQGNSGGLTDGIKKMDCPEEAKVPPQNCNDVKNAAYALGLKRGYMNSNGNSIPDVMERPYVKDLNDCSTGNAHMNCMYNDPCTEQHGRLQGIRSNSAVHASSLYVGNDGNTFECDFTPNSGGISIANNRDAQFGPAYPDPNESMDPSYNCAMNGAGYSALNPSRGSNSVTAGGGLIGAILPNIIGHMQDRLARNSQQPQTNPQIIVVTPTPEPTPDSSFGVVFDVSNKKDMLDKVYQASETEISKMQPNEPSFEF